MEETKELQTMYKIFRCLIYFCLLYTSDAADE